MNPQDLLSIVVNEQCRKVGNVLVRNNGLSTVIRELVVPTRD
jgi:hypothetical protein